METPIDRLFKEQQVTKFYDSLNESRRYDWYKKVDTIVDWRPIDELSDEELLEILQIKKEFLSKKRKVRKTTTKSGTTKSDIIRQLHINGKSKKEISIETGSHYSFVCAVVKKYRDEN